MMDREYCEEYYYCAKRYKFSLVHPLNIDLVRKSIGPHTIFRTPSSLVIENMGVYQMLFDMGRKYESDNNKSWEGGEDMGR
tara:strand:- start:361 stop:603 length:243 start_codon:yes stop_codon:yes gene_type:complete